MFYYVKTQLLFDNIQYYHDISFYSAGQGDGELLFNMTEDPLEQHDLSQVKPELAAEMKRMLTEQVRQYNLELIRNDKLISLPPITSPRDVPKWPGFHSTVYPSDLLH